MDKPELQLGSSVAHSISVADMQPKTLTIQGGNPYEALVTILLKDGSMTFGPHYTPEGAAKIFWESISQEYRTFLKWKAEHQ